MLFFTQCTGDTPSTEATTTAVPTDTTATTEPVKQVSQIDESSISPSEILKTNEAAYLALRKRVTSNLDTINSRIDRYNTNQKLRDGLKNGFQEIVKYKSSSLSWSDDSEQMVRSNMAFAAGKGINNKGGAMD